MKERLRMRGFLPPEAEGSAEEDLELASEDLAEEDFARAGVGNEDE